MMTGRGRAYEEAFMSEKDKLKKAFPEIKLKKDEKKEKLTRVPAEELAKALRQMLNKDRK